MKLFLFRSFILICVGGCLSFSVYSYYDTRLVQSDKPVEVTPKKPVYKSYEVSVKQALEWHEKKKALFLDGRSVQSFNQGHILDALLASHLDIHHNKNVLALPRDTVIVTYCNHAQCPIAHILRSKLLKMGFEKVYVFPGGMREWRAISGPIGKSLLFSQ